MSEQRTVPHKASGVPFRTLKVEVIKGPDAGKSHVAASDTVTDRRTSPAADL